MKNVQETHGMTSNAEWTGMLLSTLLEEAGVKRVESGLWLKVLRVLKAHPQFR